MSTRLARALALALPFLVTTAMAQSSTREIDATVWAIASATVSHDDMDALGKVYHPAAVVVTTDGTARLPAKLAQWKSDAIAAKAKGTKATVEFRFSRRQDDANSAFEIGIFKYTQTDRTGKAAPRFVPFECLLVKDGGRWLIVMERQLEATTEAKWNALPHS